MDEAKLKSIAAKLREARENEKNDLECYDNMLREFGCDDYSQLVYDHILPAIEMEPPSEEG